MNKKYIVTLTNVERLTLDKLIAAGKGAARRMAYARILLKADQGLTDEAIAEAVEVSRPTVEGVRKRFVEEGLEAALARRRPRREYRRKLDGHQEAQLVALTGMRCQPPSSGMASVVNDGNERASAGSAVPVRRCMTTI